MRDKVFVDTNVLLYTIGQHDARTPVAEALLEGGGVMSGRLTIHNPFKG